mgnify:FL=1
MTKEPPPKDPDDPDIPTAVFWLLHVAGAISFLMGSALAFVFSQLEQGDSRRSAMFGVAILFCSFWFAVFIADCARQTQGCARYILFALLCFFLLILLFAVIGMTLGI